MMKTSTQLFALIAVLLCCFAFATTTTALRTTPNVDPLTPPSTTSFKQYLSIFEENLKFSGTDAIVAARSKADPNYFYDWVRDSALALKALQNLYGTNTTAIEPWYARYERSVRGQLTKTEQGVNGGDIRGEVKFNVDGTLFTGPWCRLQNDGAAFRTVIRSDYAMMLIQRGQADMVRKDMWLEDGSRPGLKWELDYLLANWNAQSCDLWEESHGIHFWTLVGHRKAMIWGSRLAYKLGFENYGLALLLEARKVANRIRGMIDQQGRFVWPIWDQTSGFYDRAGSDTAVVLGFLHGDMTSTQQQLDEILTDLNPSLRKHYKNAMCANKKNTNQQYLPTHLLDIMPYLKKQEQNISSSSFTASTCEDIQEMINITTNEASMQTLTSPTTLSTEAINSLEKLMQWSKEQFPINPTFAQQGYVAGLVARYPNDIYDGVATSKGNAWILSNFVFADVVLSQAKNLYRLEQYAFHKTSINVLKRVFALATQHSPNQCDQRIGEMFFQQFDQKDEVVATKQNNILPCFWRGFHYYALHVANVVHEQIGYPMDLTEQIHREFGYEVGAHYLTWSYSAYLSFYTKYQNLPKSLIL